MGPRRLATRDLFRRQYFGPRTLTSVQEEDEDEEDGDGP